MLKRSVDRDGLFKLLIIRYVFLCVVVLCAALFIPFLPRFTYLNVPEAKLGAHILGIWANFDGVHYLGIAREGYHDIDKAFFPLYPYLIRFVHIILPINIFLVGLVLSQIFFIGGLVILNKILSEVFKLKGVFTFLTMLLVYPTAFFYSAVYTESLFFFLVMLSLFLIYKKKYVPLFIALIFASLTRIQGVFLVFPLFFALYDQKESLVFNITRIFSKHFILFAPFIGLTIYMMYLYLNTGNPLYFLSVQSLFGAHRSATIVLLPQVIVRYLRIFITANWNFQYLIATLEFIMFCMCLTLCGFHLYYSYAKKQYNELGIAFFSLANVILPTLTGTLSSIPRYSLFALSTYFMLTKLRPSIQFIVIGLFIMLQGFLLAFFAQGYFVS